MRPLSSYLILYSNHNFNLMTLSCHFIAQCFRRNDLLTAIKKLKVLGSGFALIPVGQSFLVQSVPGELTMDHTTVLQQAEVGHFMSFVKINTKEAK